MSNTTLKQILKNEGFKHIYAWKDSPNTKYKNHKHTGKVSMFITQGEIKVTMKGKEINLSKGDRFNTPVGIEHSAVVGPNGCSFIVGEEIKGDS